MSFELKARFDNIHNLSVDSHFYFSVYPVNCSDGCHCYYFHQRQANVLNCSKSDTTNFNYLEIPPATTWLIAASNDISKLCFNSSLENIVHIDIQKSNIISICDECFSKLATEGNITYLNLAQNNITMFSETLQTVHSLEEVYLAGNPID